MFWECRIEHSLVTQRPGCSKQIRPPSARAEIRGGRGGSKIVLVLSVCAGFSGPRITLNKVTVAPSTSALPCVLCVGKYPVEFAISGSKRSGFQGGTSRASGSQSLLFIFYLFETV